MKCTGEKVSWFKLRKRKKIEEDQKYRLVVKKDVLIKKVTKSMT